MCRTRARLPKEGVGEAKDAEIWGPKEHKWHEAM